jgi:hypothetical protein
VWTSPIARASSPQGAAAGISERADRVVVAALAPSGPAEYGPSREEAKGPEELHGRSNTPDRPRFGLQLQGLLPYRARLSDNFNTSAPTFPWTTEILALLIRVIAFFYALPQYIRYVSVVVVSKFQVATPELTPQQDKNLSDLAGITRIKDHYYDELLKRNFNKAALTSADFLELFNSLDALVSNRVPSAFQYLRSTATVLFYMPDGIPLLLGTTPPTLSVFADIPLSLHPTVFLAIQ